MTQLTKISVQHYRTKRVPNPSPTGELPWRQYQTVRNTIVRTCRRHGPTGPLGEFPLDKEDADLIDWEPGDDNPVYYIVDDQYNDEMYLYMEFVDPKGFKKAWLEDITETLRQFPGWGIGVNSLQKGYIIIFANKLMVTGPLFRGCRNAISIINAINNTTN
jgi:hypothetical protein